MTGDDLESEDLMELQAAKVAQPRAGNANSVPGAINLLQDEWDSAMLETFQLRKTLEETRRELAHALY